MQIEPNAIVLDLETTQKCPVGSNKANPFWPENEIVVIGSQRIVPSSGVPLIHGPDVPLYGPNIHQDVVVWVGHNIAFDLLYLLQKGNIKPDDLATLNIWDTQLAEYILTGQTQKFPSLDYCARKRGGTLKNDRVAVMFAAGKGADEVPRNMLEDYLKADLTNTGIVFKSQVAEAIEKDMLPLLWSQMDARLATIEMMNNGLAIDKEFLEKGAHALELEVERRKKLLQKPVAGTLAVLDLTSPLQLAKWLFGGTVEWVDTERVGTYKNGKPKFKCVKRSATLPRRIQPLPEWKNKTGFSVSDDVISDILTWDGLSNEVQETLKLVQNYREASKQLSTYFEAISTYTMPDGKLHGNINHCATATGRLASSEPNLQNMPKDSPGEVRKAFVSRWGKDGFIVEADYGQLEMVVLAVLSGDRQLMEDIRNGVDMHTELFKTIHGREPTPYERWQFKRCSFALIYGGGRAAIARQGKCSEAQALRFMSTFFGRYPDVASWHKSIQDEVKRARVNNGMKEGGIPIGESTWHSPISNRMYVFHEYVNDENKRKWFGLTSFSSQEIKNYPVQGGATADIVPLVVGKLFRVLKSHPRLKDKCLMTNTVHDSVVFDVHKDVLNEALYVIKETMEKAPEFIKETFGFDFPMKLKVGISYGPNWQEQQEVDTSTLTSTHFERKAA